MMNKKFMLFLTLLSLLGGTSQAQMGKLYDLSSSPFATNIAHKPGDLLTVIVMEEATTSETGTRDLSKEHELEFNLKKIFFPHFKMNKGFDDTIGDGDEPGLDFESISEYKANATNDSETSFETKLQVRIIEEIKEGQFIIRGHRVMNMNGKDTKIFVSGIIRQADISEMNEIQSHLIADAKIEIEGEIITKDLEPGMISKVFSWLLF